jgi:formylmethanofuran dehydrogenase subunit B
VSGFSRSGDVGVQTFNHVVCPFCGLLCDDLSVQSAAGRLRVTENACPKAMGGFERVIVPTGPRRAGRECSLEEAIAAAAEILKSCQQPLIAGFGTDVKGARTLIDLAECTGAVVDHMHGEAIQRNLNVLQVRGWITTTLTEIRNRADLIVLAGTDTRRDYPRFLSRCAPVAEGLFGSRMQARRVVHLGRASPQGDPATPGVALEHVRCDPQRLGELFAALRARVGGRTLQASKVAGLPIAALDKLASDLGAARYGVIVWAPEVLPPIGGDLIVETIGDLVRDLNRATRSAGFSLGGNDGAASAVNVGTWLTGYPLRVAFGRGYPEFDPTHYSTHFQLESGDADALLWISSFRTDAGPPETALPTIVLGAPGLETPREPDVYIAVGTPGLDHAAQMIRCDNVVCLPLDACRETQYPSVATVVTAIAARLR